MDIQTIKNYLIKNGALDEPIEIMDVYDAYSEGDRFLLKEVYDMVCELELGNTMGEGSAKLSVDEVKENVKKDMSDLFTDYSKKGGLGC